MYKKPLLVMDLVQRIDHTLLKSDTSSEDVKRLCEEAIEAGFWAVCVSPYFVAEAVKYLQDHSTKVATVIGFPMGYSATVAKVEETKRAITEGADEFDFVVNLNAVKSQNWNFVHNDIDRIHTACRLRGRTSKLIVEAGLLTEDEIIKLCEIASELEVDFVKTSTGVNGPGASVEVVRLLRQHLKPEVRIKASGGIRTRQAAESLIEAGADRIGTSSGLHIVAEIA